MHTVKWLHLSDLHLNTPGFGSAFLRDELIKFLKRKGIICDYVFCTGDLRDARQGKFPDDQGQFLKDICEAVEAKDLFIVPGNHDVDRGNESAGDSARHETIQRVFFHGKGYYRSDIGMIESDDLRILNKNQEDFRSYISSVLSPDRMAFYCDPLKPHFNIETEYLNVLHVDSTMVYDSGQENNLIVGMNPLYEAVKTINRNKPTVLLTHYAYTTLAQEERKYIRELLYHNGIQLWLAGHEHEHNLQPINYLHSVQSGELRLEDKCSTSVLVGEMNTGTGAGSIRAYAWFPEGWYLYPAVWHGVGRDDEYPFALKLQGNGELRSPETIHSQQNNMKYKRPTTLLDSLYADVHCGGKAYEGKNGIVNCLVDLWENSENLVLIADGGMGKTTRMLSTCDILDSKAAVYIPLESTKPENLIKDLCRAVFSDSDEERLYQYAKVRHTMPDLYFFLDGMNEVDNSAEKDFINVIRTINREYPGIQMVITSRSNFTERYRLDGFAVGRLDPLRQEQIQALFTESEWSQIQLNPPLMKLVQNPLMATLYKHISPEMGSGKAYMDWIEEITNETELIYDYYLSQMSLYFGKQEQNQLVYVAQYIRRCLPYIAFEFERNARHTMPIAEFRDLLDKAANIDTDSSVEVIRRDLRMQSVGGITGFDLEDYLFNVSHLMYESDGLVFFPHQIHRDYLSAVWLTKTSHLLECWNERVLTTTVANHVRILSKGRYWEHLAASIMDCAREREDCRNLIVNVIHTFPYTEDSGTPDFSRLDFRGIRIPDYRYVGEKIKLEGTKIDDFSIGCEGGDTIRLKGMSFSPDNSYLAGVAADELIIYSMETGTKVLKEPVYSERRSVGKAVTKFSSDLRYLFIKNHRDLIVFAKTGTMWNRVDEIEEDIIEGEDITKIASSSTPKSKEEFSIALSPDGQYKAICFQDGTVIVQYKGGKILHHLEHGRGVLQAAAISKDGNRAVTLSANTYDGRRRMQMWDLDTRSKVEERFCSGTTETLCLTDHGDWIIGFENGRSWMWKWDDKDRRFYRGEQFISETDRGLTTYGNSLLFQSGDGKLQKLNLDDNSLQSFGKYKSIKYATVIRENRIAMVFQAERYVEFDSVRDGHPLKLNRETSKIRSVHAFKTQPFIAVVTSDGMVSMYHVGTGQRTRKLKSSVGYRIVAFHPDQNVFTFSDGQRRIETFRYFEWKDHGQPRGKWCEPRHPDFAIDGKIIAIGFNTIQEEQIMIETNGKITYMQDRFCDFHSQTKVITNFSVSGYDFSGVVCSEEIMDQLVRNGADRAAEGN